MSVGVERRARGGVAHPRPHRFDVRAGSDQQRRKTVRRSRKADDGGVLTRVASENVAGEFLGYPIVLDAQNPTASGGSGDYAILMRARDLAPYQSGIHKAVYKQTVVDVNRSSNFRRPKQMPFG
jgi:hypothetical protein